MAGWRVEVAAVVVLPVPPVPFIPLVAPPWFVATVVEVAEEPAAEPSVWRAFGVSCGRSTRREVRVNTSNPAISATPMRRRFVACWEVSGRTFCSRKNGVEVVLADKPLTLVSWAKNAWRLLAAGVAFLDELTFERSLLIEVDTSDWLTVEIRAVGCSSMWGTRNP